MAAAPPCAAAACLRRLGLLRVRVTVTVTVRFTVRVGFRITVRVGV